MNAALVSESAAADDRTFFLSHPKRRCGDATSLPPDNDNAIRSSWVSAAWPWLSALERTELVREIKKGEPRR